MPIAASGLSKIPRTTGMFETDQIVASAPHNSKIVPFLGCSTRIARSISVTLGTSAFIAAPARAGSGQAFDALPGFSPPCDPCNSVALRREPAERAEIDAVELRHVLTQDRLALFGCQVAALLREHLLRPRPGRIAVGEVVRPQQSPPVH